MLTALPVVGLLEVGEAGPIRPPSQWLGMTTELYHVIKEGLDSIVSIPVVNHAIAGLMAGLALLAQVIVWPVLKIAITVGGTVGATTLQVLGQARSEAAPQLNDLMAASISELFGVPISPGELPMGASPDEARRRAKIIGEKIYGVLEEEFAPHGTVSPEQGEAAAKTFTGFTANFTIASAFIAILGELVTYGQLESFRELGVELAENLGLGRLSRRGTTELVKTLVGDPNEWHLNRKYRPARLGIGQLVKAWKQGKMSREEVEYELSLKGIPDKWMDIFLADEELKLSPAQLWREIRFRESTLENAKRHLGTTGLDDNETTERLRLEDLGRLESKWAEIINVAETAVVQRFLSDADFRELLSRAPLSDAERALEEDIIRAKLRAQQKRPSLGAVRNMWDLGIITRAEFTRYLAEEGYPDEWIERLPQVPSAELTLGQMEQAYEDGIVDLSEWKTFLRGKGYADEAQTVLTLQLLTNFEKKRLKARAKGLSLSELKKALKAGEITLEEFRKTLRDLGYGDHAVEVISAEFISPAP